MRKNFSLFFIFWSLFVYGQKEIPGPITKGLTLVSEHDSSYFKKGTEINLDHVTFYNSQGKKLKKMSAVIQLQNKANGTDLYADAQHKITTIVIRPKTEAELKSDNFKADKNAEKFTPKQSPDFTVHFLNKDSLTFDPKTNHDLYVINFWFTTCAPCKAEIPDLNKLYDKYKDKGIKFIAVTFDDKKETEKFLKKMEFNYPIAILGIETIKKFNINSFPTSLIVDKNGMIIFEKTGLSQNIYTELDNQIIKALKNN